MTKKVFLVLTVIALTFGIIGFKEHKTAEKHFKSAFYLSAKFSKILQKEDYERLKSKSWVRKFDRMIESYGKIVTEHPKSRWADDAQYCLAYSYFIYGNWNKEIEGLKKFINKYPNAKFEDWTVKESDKVPIFPISSKSYRGELYAYTQYKIGFVYYAYKKDYGHAIVEYNKVIDNYPQSHRAALSLSGIERCCRKLQDYQPALEAYQKYLAIRPKTKWHANVERLFENIKAKQEALSQKE